MSLELKHTRNLDVWVLGGHRQNWNTFSCLYKSIWKANFLNCLIDSINTSRLAVRVSLLFPPLARGASGASAQLGETTSCTRAYFQSLVVSASSVPLHVSAQTGWKCTAGNPSCLQLALLWLSAHQATPRSPKLECTRPDAQLWTSFSISFFFLKRKKEKGGPGKSEFCRCCSHWGLTA